MTLRIDIPADRDPIMYVWGEMVPGIGPAAAAFSGAVYERSTLPLREFEAARLRIAQVNGCVLCLDWRTDRAGETVDDAFAAQVADWQNSDGLSVRERLAAEYAERFAVCAPRSRRRVLAPDAGGVLRPGARRALDVPRFVDRLRAAESGLRDRRGVHDSRTRRQRVPRTVDHSLLSARSRRAILRLSARSAAPRICSPTRRRFTSERPYAQSVAFR